MPLPFAPPPVESSLYEDLKSKTLLTLTADELDTIKGKSFVQGVDGSEDEMRRLLLAGLASQQVSTAGVIPGRCELKALEVTDGTVTTLFQPDVGEAYLVMGADVQTFGTGQNGATLYLSDGVETCTIADSSSAGDMNDHTFRAGSYIDNSVYLQYKANNLSSGTGKIVVAVARVR